MFFIVIIWYIRFIWDNLEESYQRAHLGVENTPPRPPFILFFSFYLPDMLLFFIIVLDVVFTLCCCKQFVIRLSMWQMSFVCSRTDGAVQCPIFCLHVAVRSARFFCVLVKYGKNCNKVVMGLYLEVGVVWRHWSASGKISCPLGRARCAALLVVGSVFITALGRRRGHRPCCWWRGLLSLSRRARKISRYIKLIWLKIF